MRILYCDHFSNMNSNNYWAKAFRKYGEVEIVHYNFTPKCFKSLLKNDYTQYTHVHFGGSTSKKVSEQVLDFIKKTNPNIRLTFFFGDARADNSFEVNNVRRALKYLDGLYVTHTSQFFAPPAHFALHPYDPEIFVKLPTPTNQKDIVFIGNKTSDREEIIRELSFEFQTDVYGNGWDNSLGYVEYTQNSAVMSQYKIVLGCTNPKHTLFRRYTSNRLTNVLGSGCFHLFRYSIGIEEVVQNKVHAVWYRNLNELKEEIKYYLQHDEERRKISEAGYQIIQQYSFEKTAARILGLRESE